MIPHGRPALDIDSVAQRAGVSPSTWGRHHAAAFKAAVKELPGSKRPILYDAVQVDAHLSGKPVPPLPAEPDPSDLLTDAEAGAIAGVAASTIRADATTGLIAPGRELYGRRWWTRAEAEALATRKPQFKGRTPGARDTEPRRLRLDHRVDEIAAEPHRAGPAEHKGEHEPAPVRRHAADERRRGRVRRHGDTGPVGAYWQLRLFGTWGITGPDSECSSGEASPLRSHDSVSRGPVRTRRVCCLGGMAPRYGPRGWPRRMAWDSTPEERGSAIAPDTALPVREVLDTGSGLGGQMDRGEFGRVDDDVDAGDPAFGDGEGDDFMATYHDTMIHQR
ncbi:hypothetical protein [Streptomyces sp. D54]|uniref:hypothetical protein n=1 Tax=Streptomyces sp. D54 TaxID=1290289 RepID=UPI003CF8446E